MPSRRGRVWKRIKTWGFLTLVGLAVVFGAIASLSDAFWAYYVSGACGVVALFFPAAERSFTIGGGS